MVCEWIGWCALSASEQAAWVQAVGSVAGIFSAVGIAMWSRRVSMADTTARNIAEKTARYVRANRILERFHKTIDDSLADAQRLIREGGDVPIKPREVPAEVRELENELHLIPEGGGDAFTSINFFDDAQSLIKSGMLKATDSERFVSLMEEASSRCNKAAIGVRSFLFGLGS